MADIKKSNHYVTRQFLEGFCDSHGLVWTYPKDNPSNPFANKPSETALYNKLYHLQDNENINAAEDYFSDAVETPASDILKKLLNKNFPNAEEKEKLSLFFGMLMVRTPIYLDHLKTQLPEQLKLMALSGTSNFHTSFKEVHSDMDEDKIEEIRQEIIKSEFSHKLNPNFLLKIKLYYGSTIRSHLLSMRWILIETDLDYPFITSDNFMHIYHPTISDGFFKIGLGTHNICVHIPISQKISLMLVNNNELTEGLIFNVENPPLIHNKLVELKTLIESLNKAMFLKCKNYVFANSNSDILKNSFAKILKEEKN